MNSSSGRADALTRPFARALLFAGALPFLSVAANAAVVIDEDFSSGASNWTAVAGGTWGVGSGRYNISSPATGGAGELGNISVHDTSVSGDFTLSCVMNLTGTSAWDDAAVIFCYQDVNNYYYVSLNENNDGNTKGIFKVVSGTPTELSDISTTIADDTDYTVEVVRSGSSIVAKVGGNQVASATDSSFTSGKFGFGTYNDVAAFDDLLVEDATTDIQAPSVPTGLASSNIATTSVDLSWNASTDNLGVTGYRIYTNGSNPVSVPGTGVTMSGLSENTTYTFTVSAYDAADNESSQSSGVDVTTEYSSDPLDPNILGYWSFNTLDAGSTPDNSGNGNNGTVSGASLGTGQINGALNFNGSSGEVDVGNLDVAPSSGNDGITLAAWINPDNWVGSFRDDRIISKATGTAEADHYWMLSPILESGQTRLRMRLKTGGATTTLISGSGNLQLDTWTHVAGTYDGSTMRVYINGAQVGSTSKSGTINTHSSVATTIGINPDGSRPFDGLIDEVYVIDRALNSSEIGDLMTRDPFSVPDTQAPSVPTGLFASNITDTTVDLDWNASTDDVGVAGYYLYTDSANPVGVQSTSITVTGLSPETTYSFTVSAYDAAGNQSAQTGGVEVTTDEEPAQVTSPQFTPVGGTYTSAQNVTITTSTSGASIRYTTDGSTPTSTSGTVYSGPVSIGSSVTLKAIAYKSGMTDSSVTTAAYTISTGGGPTKPNASNTGYSGSLTNSGGMTITTNGTVIQNLRITGTVHVKANNVTIRNCKIEHGSWIGIECKYGNTGLLIEDCEITGMQTAGVRGSNFTARRLHIYHIGNDAFKPTSNYLIESCYIHSLGYIQGAHADGVQMISGGDGIIRWNTFNMVHDEPGYMNSQVIIIQTNVGAIDDVLIDGNWINGGGQSVQIRDKNTGYGAPTNVVITNNKFGRDYQYGIRILDGNVTWTNNTWEDNGQPAP